MVRSRVALHDGAAVVVALAAAAGAWLAVPVETWVVAGVGAVTACVRRPVLVVLTAGLLASWSGARAWEGMHLPGDHTVSGGATLVDDPVESLGAVHAVVRIDGRQFDAWARGAAAHVLEDRLAGEGVRVTGTVDHDPAPAWLAVRHVVGRVELTDVSAGNDGSILVRLANGIRRGLGRGASPLGPERRSLFAGLVIGDDRGQPVELVDDFRGSGLSHLLAVSGENVAFVLAVAAPLLRRCRLGLRAASTIGVLVLFATITRFEPSVLRATVMAGLACVGETLGRPVPSIRLLAMAVAGLVVGDPFLVHSLGFGLSVGASAGIILVSRRLAELLPGPAALRGPVSVVVGAQVGVAPLLVAGFGGVPVATLPANLLAEPVAGLVMMWGASAGVLAGYLPQAFARLLHVPTAVALWWIASVARACTDARLGELGATAPAALGLLGSSAAWWRTRRPRWAVACLVLMGAVSIIPAVSLRRNADADVELAGAGSLRRHTAEGTVLLVADTARAATALRSLRAAGVTHLDLVEMPSRQAAVEAVVAAVSRRVTVGRVVVGSGVVDGGSRTNGW